MRGAVAAALVSTALAAAPSPPRIETLTATGALPAHIAGTFVQPLAFQQTDHGQIFIFDKRAHAVYTVTGDTATAIVQIGTEPGRILDPSAFDMDPADGTFVVADAPAREERIQTFTASGSRMGGFMLTGRELPRITSDAMVLNGVGSIHFTGRSLLLNQPESGALVTEMAIDGSPIRTFGRLRPTGHEDEADLHLAFNVGVPVPDRRGGFFFVFQAGIPMFRKYAADGSMVFERHIEGPEIDEYLKSMPDRWPSRRTADGDVLPLVAPAVRTAAVDRQGRLWVALTQPVVYVYDSSGEKVRTLQLRAATGLIRPDSLFFTKSGRVLVTPGCFEFTVPATW